MVDDDFNVGHSSWGGQKRVVSGWGVGGQAYSCRYAFIERHNSQCISTVVVVVFTTPYSVIEICVTFAIHTGWIFKLRIGEEAAWCGESEVDCRGFLASTGTNEALESRSQIQIPNTINPPPRLHPPRQWRRTIIEL